MRRDPPKRLALQQRFADESKLEIFEIAKAAVDEFGRGAGGAGRQIALFAQEDRPAAPRRVSRNSASIDAAADDGEVVARFGCAALDAEHPGPPSPKTPGRFASRPFFQKEGYNKHCAATSEKKDSAFLHIAFLHIPLRDFCDSMASSSFGPPVSMTSTSQSLHISAISFDGRLSVTNTSISDRCAIRTGAERENLLLSATSTTLRACSIIAREISTSRTSKSSSVPLKSIAEVPIIAISTRNCCICATVTAPTIPPSPRRIDPPVIMTSIDLLRWSSLATWRLLVMTRSPEWPASALATSSVVVPILIRSEALSGTRRAAPSPISRLC